MNMTELKKLFNKTHPSLPVKWATEDGTFRPIRDWAFNKTILRINTHTIVSHRQKNERVFSIEAKLNELAEFWKSHGAVIISENNTKTKHVFLKMDLPKNKSYKIEFVVEYYPYSYIQNDMYTAQIQCTITKNDIN